MVEVVDTPQFKFFNVDDYLVLPRDPQPWLIKGLIPAGGVTNLYGKPKGGKSYFALDIANAIGDVRREKLLDFDVVQHGPVMYLQVDTPRNEWAGRVERLKAAGYEFPQVLLTDANLVPYPPNVMVEAIQDALKKAVEVVRPKLLVVDTLREVHEDDENDSSVMKKVITALVGVTRGVGAGLLLVSHSRKENYEWGDNITDDQRGSSYVSGRMDMIIKLTPAHLLLKGRSIGEQRHMIEQDENYMLRKNAEKAENESHLKHVLGQTNLTEKEKADLLAALAGIEPDAAKKRIQRYKKKV